MPYGVIRRLIAACRRSSMFRASTSRTGRASSGSCKPFYSRSARSARASARQPDAVLLFWSARLDAHMLHDLVVEVAAVAPSRNVIGHAYNIELVGLVFG